MKQPMIAITVHKVPHKEFCGVVILTRESDRSWKGRCSKCGETFNIEGDTKFEARVRAMRN